MKWFSYEFHGRTEVVDLEKIVKIVFESDDLAHLYVGGDTGPVEVAQVEGAETVTEMRKALGLEKRQIRAF